MDILEALNRVLGYVELEQNWNSYGADPVDREVIIRVARKLIELHRRGEPMPWVVPTPNGGLCLEWEKGKVYAEVELEPDGTGVLYEAPGQEIERDDCDFDQAVEEALRFFKRFVNETGGVS